ncbi:TRAP transporter small permease [Egibacter rhizosphaerae]|uniref:TRAP transporter small permease n=1 Tax=Egibacter rhizosphaerae TaxID=1670831 RepID=A0A411YH33_9ACTN|nr:TRAP transporter small permease [Egibacter rhizosphaerae]QBI20419.1 TRAP transporter small permease [Egibacter rhizosphaerae]
MGLRSPWGPLETVERALTAVGAIILAWLAVSITVAVLSRHFAGEPIGWTFEIAEYSLVVITFAAIALVGREDGHVRMELLGEVLPQRVQRVLTLIAETISLLVLAAAFVAAVAITAENLADGTRVSGILRIPRWLVLAIMPVGLGLLAIEHGKRLARAVRPGSTGWAGSTGSAADPDTQG